MRISTAFGRRFGSSIGCTAVLFVALSTATPMSASAATPVSAAASASAGTAPRASAAIDAPGTPSGGVLPADECRIETALGDFHEAFPIEESALPSTGRARVHVIYVDFPDFAGAADRFPGYLDSIERGIGIVESQSNGRLDIDASGGPVWTTLGSPSTGYGSETDAWDEEPHHRLIRDAVEAADADVDFGAVDTVWVVYARAPALPARSAATNTVDVRADGVDITRAITFNADDLPFSYGSLVAHEFGHTLGLPDLYSFTAGPFEDPRSYVGGWDPMSDASYAANFVGWHLWRLGWIDDGQVLCIDHGETVDVTLTDLTQREGIVIAVVRLSRMQALVVESRKATGRDEYVHQPGPLVYRVWGSMPTGSGPITIERADGAAPTADPANFMHATLLPGETVTEQGYGHTISALTTSAEGDTVRIRTGGDRPAPDPTPAPPLDPAPPDPAAPGMNVDATDGGDSSAQTGRLATVGADLSPVRFAILLMLLGGAAVFAMQARRRVAASRPTLARPTRRR
jgi:M6 family metalloprotease-like protein